MEYWDIYDADKKKTGRTMKRNVWVLADGEYHLSVLAVIGRPDGKILITRRAMDKAWAPGWWEVPGGAVKAGEDSIDAVIREVKEETGLTVTPDDAELALTYHRDNHGKGDNYFVDVYRFVKDFDESDVTIQKEEVLEFALASLDRIKELADEGIFLHYESILPVLRAAGRVE